MSAVVLKAKLKQIFRYLFSYVGIQMLMTVFGCMANKIFANIFTQLHSEKYQ